MSTTHVGRLLRDKISREKLQLSTDLSRGSASDWGNYKQIVGIIEGLERAEALLDEVEKEG